jgi:Flp pilus assembly protein TadG
MIAPPAPRGRTLRHDQRGATIVEFAIVMPVLLMLLLGTMDFGLNVYIRAVLEGAMQRAGRNSSLESAQAGQTAIDTFVSDRIKAILPNATITFARSNYGTYSNVGKPEDFTDTNGNGVRDTGECFQDINANGLWDADSSKSGLGSANDVVKYTATVSYPSLIPGAESVFHISPTTTIKATTMLRNQPFATQQSWATTKVCT